MTAALTAVQLYHWPDLASDWLRFGAVCEERRIDRRRSLALLAPDTLFALVRWRGGDYGTVEWRLWVLRAAQPGEPIETLSGVSPGAVMLLAVAGGAKVRRALALIDAIEASGIKPAAAAESWWRVAHNRLSANRDVRPYGREEHRAAEQLRRIGL